MEKLTLVSPSMDWEKEILAQSPCGRLCYDGPAGSLLQGSSSDLLLLCLFLHPCQGL